MSAVERRLIVLSICWVLVYSSAALGNTFADVRSFDFALQQGDYAATRAMLESSPSLVNTQLFFGCGKGPPIHVAIQQGSIEIVKLLLDRKADVNAKDQRGSTPLHVAARYGRAEVAALLIANNASLDAQDDRRATPLEYAAYFHKTNVMEILHQHHVGNWESTCTKMAIHQAAQSNDLVQLEELLKQHPDFIEARTLYGDTPLHAAVTARHIEAARVLLERGADVNSMSVGGACTPLHRAVYASSAMVELLLAHHANVNARTGDGQTPLLFASGTKSNQIPAILIKNGADVTAQDTFGKTALHYAAQHGDIEFCRLLVEHGAQINALDKEGQTPLHAAAQCQWLSLMPWGNSDRDTFAWLLAHGSDYFVKDRSGKTALDVAAKHQKPEIVKLLEQQVSALERK